MKAKFLICSDGEPEPEPEPEPEEPDFFGSKEGAGSGAKIKLKKEGAKSQSHFSRSGSLLESRSLNFQNFIEFFLQIVFTLVMRNKINDLEYKLMYFYTKYKVFLCTLSFLYFTSHIVS